MKNKVSLRYGYLMFSVDLKIKPKVEICNTIFYAKNNHHVSLVRLCDYSNDQQKRIFKFAQTFIKEYPIKLKKLTRTFKLVAENDQQSIIVRVEMSGLNRLISAVNRQFGYKIVYPPTHITLYTLKGQYGIPVDTPSRYRQLTQEINSRDSFWLSKSFLN